MLAMLEKAGCGCPGGASGDAPAAGQAARAARPTTRLQYSVARIAGELATVECVVPVPVSDPLHWHPESGDDRPHAERRPGRR